MKNFLTVLLFLLAWANASGQTASSRNAKEEERVKKVLADILAAWNQHDAKAFANVFAEDADFANVRGAGAHGRKEVESFHAPLFATRFKETRIR